MAGDYPPQWEQHEEDQRAEGRPVSAADAKARVEILNWRKGQIAFNFVYLANPKLADKIRGVENYDPFHRDENLDNFWNWLREETGTRSDD